MAVEDLWIQQHVHSEKIRVSKMSRLENPSDAQTISRAKTWLRHTRACNLELVGGVCYLHWRSRGRDGTDVESPSCLWSLDFTLVFNCERKLSFSGWTLMCSTFVPFLCYVFTATVVPFFLVVPPCLCSVCTVVWSL